MSVDTLEDLYAAELQELRAAKAQRADRLGDLAPRAQDGALAAAIDEDRRMTVAEGDRLDALLRARGRRGDPHEDAAMRAMLDEAERWRDALPYGPVADLALIASLRRLERVEQAALASLAGWARTLGQGEDEALLTTMLDRSGEADVRLDAIAGDILSAVGETGFNAANA